MFLVMWAGSLVARRAAEAYELTAKNLAPQTVFCSLFKLGSRVTFASIMFRNYGGEISET